MRTPYTTRIAATVCIAVAGVSIATPVAHAQKSEIVFKEYTHGYAYYYYPEVCSFHVERASEPTTHPIGSEVILGTKGTVSFSCPTGQSFKKYNLAYGSGAANGVAVDDHVKRDHPADGKKKKLEVSNTPGSCIVWAVAGCTSHAWTNVKIVPIY